MLTIAPNVDFTSALNQAAFKTAFNTFLNELRTNGAALADIRGMKNRIINGKMDRSIRGTTFAAANGFTLDRWSYAGLTEGVVTITQNSDVPSSKEFQNSLRVAVTTLDASIAAGQYSFVTQPIEGYNVRDLIGKAFTISFWVRSTKTGTHCLFLRNSIADRSYIAEYTVIDSNTWELKTVTVAGGLPTAGTWNWTNGRGLEVGFALIAGSTYQTTAGAWQTGNFHGTSNQVNCLDNTANIFAITGVQLELGTITSPQFEHRPYGVEENLCLRYLPVVSFADYNYQGQAYASTAIRAWVPFHVPARVAPTGSSSLTGIVASQANLANAGGTPAFMAASTSGCNLSVTGATGLTIGNSSMLQGVATVYFNGCEL
ncbi:MAG: hypothetical protein H2172_08010 [Opitutus sp.]|nr:hypothetical protein [Opitutus sp.]MCS6245978.1 hypothetical protein [Opitutus sp.]MCS6275941.1 hypothetical protein [Opitutus sp.]MCS6301036.1 hypothetical protein [Opitutus sp.]